MGGDDVLPLSRDVGQEAMPFSRTGVCFLLGGGGMLQGTEYSDGQPLTTAAQVQRLIEEATDVRSWALMYHGWGAWL